MRALHDAFLPATVNLQEPDPELDLDYIPNQGRALQVDYATVSYTHLMLMHPQADEFAKIVVEEGVKIVTTGAGNPGNYMACLLYTSEKKHSPTRTAVS